MNLMTDAWIPVLRADGAREKIKPWQIAETDNPVVEIAAPRPDFQGALYQFLIGILQTAFAPEDRDEWLDYWYTPPDCEQLKVALSPFSSAFEFLTENGKPAFLQDMDMPDGEQKPIAALLIEAPGGKTRKDNLDHFIKGDTVAGVCQACAATALFALQTNAPSGGVGHRVGLRGGGPLTTLLIPSGQASLWQKLWLNVLTQEDWEPKAGSAAVTVFPWMGATRISDKTGKSTRPGDVSHLQMYWGMPRRIRIERGADLSGSCSLCGCEAEGLITEFRTRNYGVNYEGPWVHPLTPYRFDPKKENDPLSLKGQPGGLGYRHWLGLNWMDDGNGDKAATNVQSFNAGRYAVLGDIPVSLWCFGYDMDNMKARCWYDHTLPVLGVAREYQPRFITFVATLINAARDVVKELRTYVKAAWFSRPGDVKGDTSMIDASFWNATEPVFYHQLYILASQPPATRFMPPSVAEEWLRQLRYHAVEIFDTWALEGDAEDMDMKRITKARRQLQAKLNSLKSLKDLNQIASATTEVA